MYSTKIKVQEFTPGPIVEKFERTIDIGDKLGVGGYYLVTNVNTNFSSGQYSTTIKCSFQASVHVDKDGKKSVEAANDNCTK